MSDIFDNLYFDESTPLTPSSSRIRIEDDVLEQRLRHYESVSDGFEATGEHFQALKAIFQEHRNVFLTGGAGTGKTSLVRHVIIPELDHRNLHWSVTATTGIAGSHLDGRTIHSFLGIGLGPEWSNKEPSPQDMTNEELLTRYIKTFDEWMHAPNVRQAVRQGVISRLRAHEVLMIDEISMMHGDGLLGYIDFMLKQIRGSDKPFGGMQMIFIGDFAQIPPVEERGDTARPDWAFLSRSWREANVKTVCLTRVFRQGEPDFIDFLNKIRQGERPDSEYVRRFVRNDMTEEETQNYTFLVPTNEQARKLNVNALKFYPEPTYRLDAEFVIEEGLLKPHELKNINYVRSDLEKSLRLLDKTLFVKIGTPVMFTVNDRGYNRFFNGTRGFVREVHILPREGKPPFNDEDSIVVGIPKKDGSETLVTVQRWPFSRNRREAVDNVATVRDSDGSMRTTHRWPVVRQFPLIPATAITIHKCVDKSTIVPTESGMFDMERICNSGKMPRVHGENGLKEATEPFVGAVENGRRITTRRGFSLVCSERHPLKRAGVAGFEWVKSPDLRVGDIVRMRGNTQAFGDGSLPENVTLPEDYHTHGDYRLPHELSDDLAWLLGALVGDGCQSDERDGRIDITSMDWELINRFADVMKSEFGLTATLKPKPTSKARVSYIHNWGVRRWLLQLGLSHATAIDKHVPRAIFTGSRNQQVAFLRGYFDADGGVNTAVHVTSSSIQLIREVHLMLLNLGIVGTIATMKYGWRINITGVDIIKFRDIVGFSIPRKMRACERRAPSHRKVPKVECGFYPEAFGRELAATIRDELRSVYPHTRGLGFGDAQHWAWFLSRAALGTCRLSDAHLASMQRDLPKCREAGPVCAAAFGEAAAGCFLDEIISIEEVQGDMRDICVPDGHAFVGNGFVNHNSQGMSMDKAILSLSRSFAAGQVYVGLSRLRSSDGMVLVDSDFEVKVDECVRMFYAELNQTAAHESGH